MTVGVVARNWREIRAEAVATGRIDPQRAAVAHKENAAVREVTTQPVHPPYTRVVSRFARPVVHLMWLGTRPDQH